MKETVDEEGGIWCVVFGAGRIDRYWPDGRLDRSIELPVSRPTSCMFGGPDLRTLFVADALPGNLVAFEHMPRPGLPLPTWPHGGGEIARPHLGIV